MSNDLIKKNPQNNVEVEKIQTYLETMNLTTNLTKSEVKQFIEISQAFGLNPFKREIYASKFGDRFSIIVGFETYLKRAERSGLLSGWSVTTDGQVNFQNIGNSNITATITIHRKDWNQPFIHTVHFAEYVQRTGKGEINKFWREKPITMIKKVAMAQGFRLCFSDENGGLPYTSEELGTETVTDAIVMESNIQQPTDQQAPAKRGRPKKEQPEFDPTSTIAKIRVSMSVEELLSIYNDCPGCNGHPEIMKALKDRKNFLLTIGQIDNCQSDEQVWEILETVKDSEILKYGEQKLIQLAAVEINSMDNQTPQINDNELF